MNSGRLFKPMREKTETRMRRAGAVPVLSECRLRVGEGLWNMRSTFLVGTAGFR
jgi:hypothetical protein